MQVSEMQYTWHALYSKDAECVISRTSTVGKFCLEIRANGIRWCGPYYSRNLARLERKGERLRGRTQRRIIWAREGHK